MIGSDGKADGDAYENESSDIQQENRQAKLNATEIDLYYLADEDKKYITPASGHRSSFQFKVSGVPKDEIIKWSIETDKRGTAIHRSVES